jgi:hypothetical protein
VGEGQFWWTKINSIGAWPANFFFPKNFWPEKSWELNGDQHPAKHLPVHIASQLAS